MSSLFSCLKSLAPRSRKRSQKQESKPSKVELVAQSIVSIRLGAWCVDTFLTLTQQISTPAVTTATRDEDVTDRIGRDVNEEIESEAVEYTAEPIEENVTNESEATTAAGQLLQEDDRVGRGFIDSRTDTNAIPRIAVQRQATLNVENGGPPALDRSPSVGSLTPRPSRDNSQSSLRSRADSKGSSRSSTAGHCLKEQLENAKVECAKHHHDFLIPKCALQELITVSHVAADIQARDPEIEDVEAAYCAKTVCRCAPRLYATLAYTKKGSEIKGLLAEGVTDEDLPFVRKANGKTKYALTRKNGETIKTLETWKDKHLLKFDQHQWWVSAPVFRPNEELYELDDKTVLPFVTFEPPEGIETKKQGGYSEVYPVRIHPAHHEFWESSGCVVRYCCLSLERSYMLKVCRNKSHSLRSSNSSPTTRTNSKKRARF